MEHKLLNTTSSKKNQQNDIYELPWVCKIPNNKLKQIKACDTKYTKLTKDSIGLDYGVYRSFEALFKQRPEAAQEVDDDTTAVLVKEKIELDSEKANEALKKKKKNKNKKKNKKVKKEKHEEEEEEEEHSQITKDKAKEVDGDNTNKEVKMTTWQKGIISIDEITAYKKHFAITCFSQPQFSQLLKQPILDKCDGTSSAFATVEEKGLGDQNNEELNSNFMDMVYSTNMGSAINLPLSMPNYNFHPLSRLMLMGGNLANPHDPKDDLNE